MIQKLWALILGGELTLCSALWGCGEGLSEVRGEGNACAAVRFSGQQALMCRMFTGKCSQREGGGGLKAQRRPQLIPCQI